MNKIVNFIIRFARKVTATLHSIISSISKPNPQLFLDKAQFQLCHQRYQSVINFFLMAMVIVTSQLLLKRASSMSYIVNIWLCLTIIILIIVTRNFNPNVFKILCNIVIGLYGPALMWSDLHGVHRAWIATILLPTVILFCTGSTRHFLIQALVQLILLSTIYQPLMLDSVVYMSPEDFIKSLTNVSFSLEIMNISITFFVFAAIQTANERIGAAEKKKDEFERQKFFILGFSHELRNSINSLMGNVKLASLERISEKAQKFLQIADICGELLLHLINNILDTSKAQIGDLEINPEQTNIYDAMERIWGVCSEIIKRKNLQGRFVICTNLPRFLNVDHYRLMQVFLNVVGNAVKFTDRGEINVSVDWIENKEKVTTKSFEPYPFDQDNDTSEGIFEKNQALSSIDPNYIVLNSSNIRIDRRLLKHSNSSAKGILKVSVSDTGYGISKDNIKKLFQQFSQVSSDPSQRKLGTGLGLFITKELCGRMSGDIRVFSKEGTGSCFTFCIPLNPMLVPIANSTVITELDYATNHHSKLKALIVDDESFSQVILKNFFDKLQIEVADTAENGLEAYNKYCKYVSKNDNLVALTMDITMPIMNGKEAARKIRKFEEENGIKPCLLVVISGNCSESEIAECLDKSGSIRANAFLKKPARIDEISRVINQYVTREDSITF